jgi:hypothetical protein
MNTDFRRSGTVAGSALIAGFFLAAPASAAAMDGKVAELRANAGAVRAAIDLTDAFPENLRSAMEQGATLHIRVEAELWEDRTWDRLVRPATVAAFRLSRRREGNEVAIADVSGGLTSYPDYPNPLRVYVDLAPVDRIVEGARYYVNAVVTIGTLAEGEIADAGAAVFGKDDGSVGLKSAGRFILNTVLRVTDYLQSVTATIRSGKFAGKEIRSR